MNQKCVPQCKDTYRNLPFKSLKRLAMHDVFVHIALSNIVFVFFKAEVSTDDLVAGKLLTSLLVISLGTQSSTVVCLRFESVS